MVIFHSYVKLPEGSLLHGARMPRASLSHTLARFWGKPAELLSIYQAWNAGVKLQGCPSRTCLTRTVCSRKCLNPTQRLHQMSLEKAITELSWSGKRLPSQNSASKRCKAKPPNKIEFSSNNLFAGCPHFWGENLNIESSAMYNTKHVDKRHPT